MVLKYAGAAYLLYLAYKSLKEQQILLPSGTVDGQTWWVMFRRGFIMNVVNPKVALFFLAFLPQFVSGRSGDTSWQIFILGMVFMVQGAVVFSAIGYLSGSVVNLVVRKPLIARYFGWLTASVFASLGVRLALA